MRCEDYKGQIIEYLEGHLSENERKLFNEHISTCASCKKQFINLQATFKVIDDEKVLKVTSSFDEEVMRKLRKGVVKTLTSFQKIAVAASVFILMALGSGFGLYYSSTVSTSGTEYVELLAEEYSISTDNLIILDNQE